MVVLKHWNNSSYGVCHVGVIQIFGHAYDEGDFYCKTIGGRNALTGSIVSWPSIWSRNSILDCICKFNQLTTFVIIETLRDWQSLKQTYGLVNPEVEQEIIIML